MNENRPCDIAALLRDTERYVVESVWSRATNEQAAVVSTSRLHNIAGKYTGKDDPVMLIRVQMDFPATGEVLTPFAAAHFVAGGKRGSHQMPLMPVPRNTPTNYFDGPPRVTCAAYSMHAGKLSGPRIASPIRSGIIYEIKPRRKRSRCVGKVFFGAAMLPMSKLEYTGITQRLAALAGRFRQR